MPYEMALAVVSNVEVVSGRRRVLWPVPTKTDIVPSLGMWRDTAPSPSICTSSQGTAESDCMVRQGVPAKDAISFGPFSLIASERVLTKEGIPVELGSRALDTLIALVSSPNEV